MSMLPEVEEAKPQYHPSFDDEDADTVLSSNDHMLFRLPRVTLRKSSGYFRNLFDSSNTSEAGKGSESGLYQLPFATAPLEHALLLISGLPLPLEHLTFYETENMVDVMCYLDTPGPLSTIRTSLLQQFRGKPVLVYGLATKMNWNDLRQQAAELTLPINILSSGDAIDAQLAHLSNAPSLLSLIKLHQRRKDLFRSQIHSRSQFQVTCGLCCDPMRWRLLVARLEDELNQDCSGKSIVVPGGMEEWSETKNCWKGFPCKNERCDFRHGMANRMETLKKIRGIVQNLPKVLPNFT